MDIRCPICAEPWDADSIHDEVSARWPNSPWEPKGWKGYATETSEERARRQATYERKYYTVVKTDFRRRGCIALATAFGTSACEPTPRRAMAEAVVAIMSLSDHVDDWATDLEDAEQMGLF